MRRLIPLFALILAASLVDFAAAQGFYRNTVRRNPITGQLEIVPNTQGFNRWQGPGVSGFNGAQFNPYTGTLNQTAVRRNTVTGRTEVINEYYNPWTGARLQTGSRFNPLTGQTETMTFEMPPTRSFPSEEEAAPELATERAQPQNTGTRPKRQPPKVINTPTGESETPPALP
jgi:hypothetical protein